jgi:hypothetical protein
MLQRVGNRHSGIEMCARDAAEREDQCDKDRACRDCVREKRITPSTPNTARRG